MQAISKQNLKEVGEWESFGKTNFFDTFVTFNTTQWENDFFVGKNDGFDIGEYCEREKIRIDGEGILEPIKEEINMKEGKNVGYGKSADFKLVIGGEVIA